MTKTNTVVTEPTNGTSNADKAVAQVVKETLKVDTEKVNESKTLPEKTKEMV